MEDESISSLKLTEKNELLLCILSSGKPHYQYIYREAAGVYWDEKQHGFKSTELKNWSCPQWFSHIVSIVKNSLDVELQLNPDATWHNISEEDKNEIKRKQNI